MIKIRLVVACRNIFCYFTRYSRHRCRRAFTHGARVQGRKPEPANVFNLFFLLIINDPTLGRCSGRHVVVLRIYCHVILSRIISVSTGAVLIIINNRPRPSAEFSTNCPSQWFPPRNLRTNIFESFVLLSMVRYIYSHPLGGSGRHRSFDRRRWFLFSCNFPLCNDNNTVILNERSSIKPARAPLIVCRGQKRASGKFLLKVDGSSGRC